MVHGEVAGLKNGEPVMAGVLKDHRDKIDEDTSLFVNIT